MAFTVTASPCSASSSAPVSRRRRLPVQFSATALAASSKPHGEALLRSLVRLPVPRVNRFEITTDAPILQSSSCFPASAAHKLTPPRMLRRSMSLYTLNTAVAA